MTFLARNLLVWILPALVLVVVIAIWAVRRRRAALRNLIGSAGPSALVSNASAARRRVLRMSMLAALVLVAIAVLRPAGGSYLTEHRLPAKNIVLLIDVSKSMGIEDAGGLTRLEAAKFFAREFVARRAADRIGLVSFAGAAFSECPTTLDRTTLIQRIDVQKPGGLPAGGTDLSAALTEADSLLTESPPPGSAIVILSDGDNMRGQPVESAQKLADRGIPVFTVAFGDPDRESPVPGSKAASRPDFAILEDIAETTGAISLVGNPSIIEGNLATLTHQVDAIDINGTTITSELFSRPLELYAYPLSIAVLLLFIRLFLPARTRNWHPLAGLLILALFPAPSIRAQEPNPALTAAIAEARDKDHHLLLIFTGSDWSEASIAFEKEILSHPVYKDWALHNVVVRTVDLPQARIDPEMRRQRRLLASHFAINTYPTALFLDTDENELGRLTHDPNGPASWTRRADAILAGNRDASDTVASIDRLPEGIREMLEDPALTPAERSLRHYNHAVELEKYEPMMAIASRDRFDLLEELHLTAAFEAPEDEPWLAFAPTYKIALLHHLRGRLFIQQKPARALEIFRTARQYYEDAAGQNPEHLELPGNLALLHKDSRMARQIIEFQKAYKAAVETTYAAYQQEERLRRSLEFGVGSAAPLNDSTIGESVSTIESLIERAKEIEFPQLENFTDAHEDIVLAPVPHDDSHLQQSSGHIKDALDHLLQVARPQPQPGDGDGENSEGDDPGGKGEGDEKGKGDGEGDDGMSNSESDLREAQGQGGSLRDRMLEKLRREAEPVSPGRDR